MYSLEDFEPYVSRKPQGQEPVLAWSKKNGYHFLSLAERSRAICIREEFKIIAVLKEKPNAVD